MKRIKIVNKVILLNLIYEESFNSLNKYIIDSNNEDYSIISKIGSIDINNITITNKTEFYDMGIYNNSIIQLQHDGNNKYMGAIIYKDNIIELIMFDGSFNLEYLLSQYAFLYILEHFDNAIFMHGSSIYYNDIAILFSAKSGTGKSTHRSLWEKYRGSVAINDDKNVIVYENDELVIYPNPWSGKHQIDNNIKAPLKAIVFLYQSKTNEVRRLKPIEGLRLILGQVTKPSHNTKETWNKMIDRLLSVPIYYLGCDISEIAVNTIYERLKSDKICQ